MVEPANPDPPASPKKARTGKPFLVAASRPCRIKASVARRHSSMHSVVVRAVEICAKILSESSG